MNYVESGHESFGLINREELKIILLGDSGVGKSSIAKYLSGYGKHDATLNQPVTITYDLMNISVVFDGRNFKVSLWDTAGSEQFRAVTSNFYRNADGAIIVYDVTNWKSFENIESPSYYSGEQILAWWDELQGAVPLRDIKAITFLGNKVDMEAKRQVPNVKGRSVVDYLTDVPEARGKVIFREVSAVTGEGLDGLLEEMISIAVKHKCVTMECPSNPVEEITAFRLQSQTKSNVSKCSC